MAPFAVEWINPTGSHTKLEREASKKSSLCLSIRIFIHNITISISSYHPLLHLRFEQRPLLNGKREYFLETYCCLCCGQVLYKSFLNPHRTLCVWRALSISSFMANTKLLELLGHTFHSVSQMLLFSALLINNNAVFALCHLYN